MTVLPIVVAPDPRLKVPSNPVEEITDETRALMDDMLETMYASNGIGLAAVQIGVHQRILVMDIGAASARYPEKEEHIPDPIFMVNPEIVEESDDINVYEEGCLSFPGQYAEVKRPESVKVRYFDYDGRERMLEADGLLATCVQHEMDHLNGVVFVDHVSSIKRDMIMRKLKKAQKNQS